MSLKSVGLVLFTLMNMGYAAAESALVISHRGASGERPEHTLEAYRLALDLGSRWLEPDLVMSKDCEIWIRHELDLSDTTNVADIFPDRKRRRKIDGKLHEGYFVDDFTSQELAQLKARQRVKTRNQKLNDKFELVRFVDFLNFVEKESLDRGFPIGIVPEIKHSAEHLRQGFPLLENTIALLLEHQNKVSLDHVIVQSFEVGPLINLKKRLPGIRTLQLVEAPLEKVPGGLPRPYRGFMGYLFAPLRARFFELLLPKALSAQAAQVDYLGPPKELMQIARVRRWFKDSEVRWIPYTFKFEDPALDSSDLMGLKKEIQKFLSWGASGIFTDESRVISQLVLDSST